MAARTIGGTRTPRTSNERRATAAFMASEDGRLIRFSTRRAGHNLADDRDDRQVAEATKRARMAVITGSDSPDKGYDSLDKIQRLEARRISRKFKAVVGAALAKAVASKDEAAQVESGEDYGWEELTYGRSDDYASMSITARYFGKSTNPVPIPGRDWDSSSNYGLFPEWDS